MPRRGRGVGAHEMIKTFFKNLFTDKRFKSLLWRVGMMLLAFVVDFAIQFLAGVQLPPYVSISLGLLLGEASKALHNTLGETQTN